MGRGGRGPQREGTERDRQRGERERITEFNRVYLYS